jgi:hypothetical protein
MSKGKREGTLRECSVYGYFLINRPARAARPHAEAGVEPFENRVREVQQFLKRQIGQGLTNSLTLI